MGPISILCILSTIGRLRALDLDIQLDRPIHRVEPEFLSFTLDCSLLAPPKWRTFSFSSARVLTLMKGLSPAYLRFGGTTADFKTFQSLEEENHKNYTINGTDIDRFVRLVRQTKNRFLYDLNLLLRNGDEWNSSNAEMLLQYITRMKYQDVFNFELGNEPNSFKKHFNISLSGTRIGKDFWILHKLLGDYNLNNSTLVGPDIGQVHSDHGMFAEFIKEAGSLLTAATFHHYYFKGPGASVADYTDPRYFPGYEKEVRLVKKVIQESRFPHLSVWLGEGADAYGSGTPNISDRFVSGFLWLDKLGISAKQGIGVVMRQAYFNGAYSLTDKNNLPNPDYWLSYIHKRLVGQNVLNVTAKHKDFEKNPAEVRVYSHCTKPNSIYLAGSVTVFALSVKKSGPETLKFPPPLSSQTVDVYQLTPVGSEGLTSRMVALNGKTLQLTNKGKLPELVPVKRSASGIQLPPLTFAFYVFPDANAPACK